MNLTAYSHAQVTDVSSNSSNGTYWVDACLDGTLVTLFLSAQNLQGVKEWAAELLKMCVAVERNELSRVETDARHAVAKTNSFIDHYRASAPQSYDDFAGAETPMGVDDAPATPMVDPPIFTGIIPIEPGGMDLNEEDDDIPF